MGVAAKRRPIADQASWHVLRPWVKGEGITVAEAAALAGVSPITMRRWAAQYDFGRHVGDKGNAWRISKPALLMFLESDFAALAAYRAGNRGDPRVRHYFKAAGLADPAQ